MMMGFGALPVRREADQQLQFRRCTETARCFPADWPGAESFVQLSGTDDRCIVTAYRAEKLLATEEVNAVLHIARHCLDFASGPDSVDDRPTFEAYPYDRGHVRHEALWNVLQDIVRERIEPWARSRYSCPKACINTVLLRRYLPDERRVHPAHFDAHAFATCVVGLNPQDFHGGLYVQPTPSSARRFVALDAGDAVLHQYDLRHGVEVTHGERYSLIFWLKDCEESCVLGTTPWYAAAAAQGSADATYNLANLLMQEEGREQEARSWFAAAATVGQPDAAMNLGCMLYHGKGGSRDEQQALHWWEVAARGGKLKAARHIGIALLKQSDEKRDVALSWILVAAQGGDAEAIGFLADLPAGRDVWRPCERDRRRWRRQAAEHGSAEAQLLLGEEKWRSWLELVSSPYYAGSKKSLDQWLEATLWLRRAANGGSAAAMLQLAVAFCHPGIPHVDLCPAVRSFTWLRRARAADAKFAHVAEKREAAIWLESLHYTQGYAIPRPWPTADKAPSVLARLPPIVCMAPLQPLCVWSPSLRIASGSVHVLLDQHWGRNNDVGFPCCLDVTSSCRESALTGCYAFGGRSQADSKKLDFSESDRNSAPWLKLAALHSRNQGVDTRDDPTEFSRFR
eukprot:gnl/TRDRNA2_/TRDRNA2_140710_c0_seq1.p1 gnl/TRDRNA2_/TRDRNA2_140710_c0~~gnl/TRDRNA2_/TRDRNA2_140710_c0_seq1.p1  ORF type:complete len:626 (+),score=85.34 gnl/TRDRNA2_/TRDRNA2_140710_c0_seq1:24-1901(+)